MWTLWGVQYTDMNSYFPEWASVNGLYSCLISILDFFFFYKYTNIHISFVLCFKSVCDRPFSSVTCRQNISQYACHSFFARQSKPTCSHPWTNSDFCLSWLLLKVRKSGFSTVWWWSLMQIDWMNESLYCTLKQCPTSVFFWHLIHMFCF